MFLSRRRCLSEEELCWWRSLLSGSLSHFFKYSFSRNLGIGALLSSSFLFSISPNLSSLVIRSISFLRVFPGRSLSRCRLVVSFGSPSLLSNSLDFFGEIGDLGGRPCREFAFDSFEFDRLSLCLRSSLVLLLDLRLLGVDVSPLLSDPTSVLSNPLLSAFDLSLLGGTNL